MIKLTHHESLFIQGTLEDLLTLLSLPDESDKLMPEIVNDIDTSIEILHEVNSRVIG